MARRIAKRTRLLIGLALGAVLMYFYDPEVGPGRRTRLQSKLRSQARNAKQEAESGSGPTTRASDGFGSAPAVTDGPLAPPAASSSTIEGELSTRPLAG